MKSYSIILFCIGATRALIIPSPDEAAIVARCNGPECLNILDPVQQEYSVSEPSILLNRRKSAPKVLAAPKIPTPQPIPEPKPKPTPQPLKTTSKAEPTPQKSTLKLDLPKIPGSSTKPMSTSLATSTAPSSSTTTACKAKRAAPQPQVKGKMGTGARNTVLSYELDCKDPKTTTTHMTVITSVIYQANPSTTQVLATCKAEWGQACYHYSSAIANNPTWSTLTCPQAAATETANRKETGIVNKWSTSRNGAGWLPGLKATQCQRDEYPPVYLLDPSGPIAKDRGTSRAGQRLRVLPDSENTGASSMWTGICFTNALPETDAKIIDAVAKKRVGAAKHKSVNPSEYFSHAILHLHNVFALWLSSSAIDTLSSFD